MPRPFSRTSASSSSSDRELVSDLAAGGGVEVCVVEEVDAGPEGRVDDGNAVCGYETDTGVVLWLCEEH